MAEEDIPIVRTLLIESQKFESFNDLNQYLRLISVQDRRAEHTFKSYNDKCWFLNYRISNKSVIDGLVIPLEQDGIFFGLERNENYSNIFADFVYKRKDRTHSLHLQPIFLKNYEIMQHFSKRLKQLFEGNFSFRYLDEGEYLKEEAELVLQQEDSFLKQEISLLELCDVISVELEKINKLRVLNNQSPIEFSNDYNLFLDKIKKLPPDKRTPILETRLNM